jgi:hypothetical protein
MIWATINVLSSFTKLVEETFKRQQCRHSKAALGGENSVALNPVPASPKRGTDPNASDQQAAE